MGDTKKCVFSGSTEGLNTAMTINFSGESIQVWVSDAYLDVATPVKVKEAYLKQKTEFDVEKQKLIEQAAKLGLTIIDNSVILPASAPQISAPIPASPVLEAKEGNLVVDGKTADKKAQVEISGQVSALGGSAGGSAAEYDISTEEKPSEDLKEGEVAEIGTVKGRGGMDIRIPVRRKGKTGETKIKVVNTGGDAALQNRFKQMAAEEPKKGYGVSTAECGLCRGTGKVMDGQDCPKCNGVGLIDIQRH